MVWGVFVSSTSSAAAGVPAALYERSEAKITCALDLGDMEVTVEEIPAHTAKMDMCVLWQRRIKTELFTPFHL